MHKSNQKGQTLIAIIALMLAALIIGITLSTRVVSTVRSLTGADDASKAQAIAEAALENMLIVDADTLEDYIDYNNCGSNCVFEITDITGKTARADVTLSYAGNTSNAFDTNLTIDNVFQLNMHSYGTGQTIDVCWDTLASVYVSYIYEESDGDVLSDSYAYNASNTTYSDNAFSTASARNGHLSCFAVTAKETPVMLRVKPYYLDSQVFFIPVAGQVIPKQGILIDAVGKAGKSTGHASALKTTAIAPFFFDYVLYQRSTTEPLSNRTY